MQPRKFDSIRPTGVLVLLTSLLLRVIWFADSSSMLGAEPPARERFFPIPLTPKSGQPQAPINGPWRAVLSKLPAKSQSFGGVPFEITAPVPVLGLDAAREGYWFPPQSETIPVGNRLGTVHLLHGLLGEARGGTPIIAVAFHYADRQVSLVRMAAGVHLLAAKPLDGTAPGGRLADPNSQIVWTAPPATDAGASTSICLTRVINPRPDQPVQAIQFLSMFSDASALVLGVTWDSASASAEPESPKRRKPSSLERRALALPAEAWRQPLGVKLEQEPGAPIPKNAEVFLSVSDGSIRFLLDRSAFNGEGEATVHYPPSQTVSFDLVVRAPGRVAQVISHSRTNGSAFPRQITTKLRAGVQVGGRVESADGKPVIGCAVTAYSLTSFLGRSWGRADFETALTDSQGKWELSSLPEEMEGMDFEVAHPAFTTRQFRVESSSTSADHWSREALLNRTATARLDPALQVSLTVQDEQSKPLEQAQISVLRQGRVPPVPLGATDARGQFTVSAVQLPPDSSLLIEKDGLAPSLFRPTLSDVSEVATVRLVKPVMLRGVLTDQQSIPIPGAEVRLDSWNNTPLFSWKTISDAQGRFFWSNAPQGSVSLRLSKSDYQQNQYRIDWQANRELRLTMYRYFTATGTVVDEATGKPIREFRVLRGWSYSPETPLHWERYNTFRGRNGTYSVRLQNYGSNTRMAVMIEAPGYEPQVSEETKGPQSIQSSFRLHAGHGLAGTVLDPNGQPVANASLTLVSAQESVYLDKPAPPSRSSNYSDQSRSDAEGRFEFQPRLFPSRIVAVHDAGFADVSVDELKTDPQIRLQPYGRVEGTFHVGDGIWKSNMMQLRLQTFSLSAAPAGDRISGASLGYRATPDATGHFVFDRVPPGLRQVCLEYKFTDRRNADTAYSHETMVYVDPGKTAKVVLGGKGRLLRGRVRVTGADPEMIDWAGDVHRMTWLQEGSSGLPVLELNPQDSPSVRAAKSKRYPGELARFMASPRGLELQERQHNYVLVFGPDGSFQVENVMPGRYSIQISPYEHDQENYNSRQLGFVSHEIVVPRGGADNEVFDMGAIDLVVRGILKTGRKLPTFQVPDLSGQTIGSDSFKGKVGVLYFWNSQSMSDLEIKMLRDLLQGPETTNKVALLMWNIDGDPKACRKFVESRKVPGMVCALESPMDHPLLATLGLENYPSALVIDSSNKITGINLRGSGIKSSVLRAVRAGGRQSKVGTLPVPAAVPPRP